MTHRIPILVGWVGTVLVALAVGRLAAVDPRWDALLAWMLAAGAACVLAATVLALTARARSADAAARSRPLPLVALASAVLLGIVVAFFAERYGARWDVTADRIHELSAPTRGALARVDAPVRVRLFTRRVEFARYRDRMREYTRASRRVTVNVEDVDGQSGATPGERREPGMALLEYKDHAELFDFESEQAFTNALARLQSGRTRTVYFTEGHVERDTASAERAGYSVIAARLRRENFRVETIKFSEQDSVPADATLVIVAGPRGDFFTVEVEALRRYVARGGAMLFMVDPVDDLKRYITESGLALFMLDPSSASAPGAMRNLTAFLREQGVELRNDVIVDNGHLGQYLNTDASVPVVARYPPHPITRGLTALSAYPVARSVRAIPASGRTASPFIESGDDTWSETDLKELGAGRLSLDPQNGDVRGPATLAVAVSTPAATPAASGGGPPRDTRLVVVGDSDFIANYSTNIPGNVEMLLAIVRWLAQEQVITIPPRLPQQRIVDLSASEWRAVFWFAVLLLPGAAFTLAASRWGRLQSSRN